MNSTAALRVLAAATGQARSAQQAAAAADTVDVPLWGLGPSSQPHLLCHRHREEGHPVSNPRGLSWHCSCLVPRPLTRWVAACFGGSIYDGGAALFC